MDGKQGRTLIMLVTFDLCWTCLSEFISFNFHINRFRVEVNYSQPRYLMWVLAIRAAESLLLTVKRHHALAIVKCKALRCIYYQQLGLDVAFFKYLLFRCPGQVYAWSLAQSHGHVQAMIGLMLNRDCLNKMAFFVMWIN